MGNLLWEGTQTYRMKFFYGLGVIVRELASCIHLIHVHTVVQSLCSGACSLTATTGSSISFIIFARSGATSAKVVVVTLPSFLLVGMNDINLSG